MEIQIALEFTRSQVNGVSMKKDMLRKFTVSIAVVITAAVFVNAQTYNSNAGGWSTGYGTVYGSFGLAQATQNIYNTTQMNIQRLMMRQAMIKKWGLAAVEKAEREAKTGSRSAATNSGPERSGPAVSAPPVKKNFSVFRPDPSIDPGKNIANALGETPDEKVLIRQIVKATKIAFEGQPTAGRMKNRVSGALTFFVIATSSIYNASEEPNDDAAQVLFDAIDQSIDEIPEFGSMTNARKQELYNALIGMAAIPLATYTEGQQNGDAATVQTARQLAGELLKMVMKVEPDRVKYSNGAWRFGN